jgi:hypothetical protein
LSSGIFSGILVLSAKWVLVESLIFIVHILMRRSNPNTSWCIWCVWFLCVVWVDSLEGGERILKSIHKCNRQDFSSLWWCFSFYLHLILSTSRSIVNLIYPPNLQPGILQEDTEE